MHEKFLPLLIPIFFAVILLNVRSASAQDCNTNGVPDALDIDPADPDGNGQVSVDCNTDLIPDECQLGSNDCDGNGLLDECDVDSTGSFVEFDGERRIAQILPDANLDFEKNDRFTIECWVFVETPPAIFYQVIVEKRHFGVPFPFSLRVRWDGRVTFESSGANGQSEATDIILGNTAIDDGAWHHVAAVKNSTTSMALYIDGELDGTLSFPTTFSIMNSQSVIVGNSQIDLRQMLTGGIDELRIWDRLRTPTEIREFRYRRVAPNTPGLVGLWTFDEGVGQDFGNRVPGGSDGFFGVSPLADIADPAWQNGGTQPLLSDCNENLIPDTCESLPFQSDCDDDGILDACQPGGANDCDNDGISDRCAIALGQYDCNDNMIPDECEAEVCSGDGVTCADCDFNGVFDSCDIIQNGCPVEDLLSSGCLPMRASLVATNHDTRFRLEFDGSSSIDIGDFGIGNIGPGGGLAYDPINHRLFAVTWSSPSTIYELDRADGSATVIAQLPAENGILDSLAYDTDQGLLYTVTYESGGGVLYSCDPATGQFVEVGPTASSIWGLTYDPTTGWLYGSTHQLTVIDKHSGDFARIPDAFMPFAQGLTYDYRTGLFYYTTQGRLFTFDLATNVSTLIGYNIDDDVGLALVIENNDCDDNGFFDYCEGPYYDVQLFVNELTGTSPNPVRACFYDVNFDGIVDIGDVNPFVSRLIER